MYSQQKNHVRKAIFIHLFLTFHGCKKYVGVKQLYLKKIVKENFHNFNILQRIIVYKKDEEL